MSVLIALAEGPFGYIVLSLLAIAVVSVMAGLAVAWWKENKDRFDHMIGH